MDPSADLPQPQVPETQEVLPPADTGLVLKRIEAYRILADNLGLIRERHKGIQTSTQQLGQQVDHLLKKDPRSYSRDDRYGSLTTPDGRTLSISSTKLRDDSTYYDYVSFNDPQNPKITVEIGNVNDLIELKDENGKMLSSILCKKWDRKNVAVWWKGEIENLPPPSRDPQDAAREGLDYFLQHADELKPVEPSPQTPPTPPSPSV